MYTQPVAVRSVLDPRYLTYSLSQHYDLGEWTECLYWLRGLNDTYRVRTASGLYILRVYRVSVPQSDVDYELSLLTQVQEALRSSGTHVSEAISRTDNALYSVVEAPEGKRFAAVFRYLNGTENMLHDEASCFLFGRSTAELHAAMDSVQLDKPRVQLDTSFLIQQPLQQIVDFIGEDHEAVPFLRAYAGKLAAEVAAAASKGLDFGLCHGDLHGNNNAFQEGEHFTHYDFEWAAPGWRAYDLAQVKARKRQPAEQEQREQLWQAILAGYRSVRAFSAHDEASVELFIAVRRLWIMSLDVAFVPNDMGALDYGEDYVQALVEEFKGYYARFA